MARVIERHGHSVDNIGLISYDDRPTTYERADVLAGRRLSRRKNYAVIDGEVCEAAEWVQTCSGCDGNGCSECGYHGRRRRKQWIPLMPNKGDTHA